MSQRQWPRSRRSRLELAVAPAAVRIARRWTAEQLVRSGQGRADADADLIDSAVLAVSELVTNAIAAVAKDTPPDAATAAEYAAACVGASFHARSPAAIAVLARPLAAPPILLAASPIPLAASPIPLAASPTPAAPRVLLVIDCLEGLVRIEVHDSSRDPLPPPGHSGAEDETGRGLMVVAALARKWGWEPEPAGKMVWCELAG